VLGGRLSDLFGAKSVFAAGWAVLTVGSLAAGLAESTAVEIAARAAQGAGAALIAPSALTLLMMLFGSDPKELTKAFAVYGAAAPAGGTAGVFLGGGITEWISWPWVFYINIPIALLVLALTPGLMPGGPVRRGSVDLAGAVTATASIALFPVGPCYHTGHAPEGHDALVLGYAALAEHDFDPGLETLGRILAASQPHAG